MRSTVTAALPQRVETAKPDALDGFVNRELLPVATKARAVLNYQNIESATGDSDGTAAYVTLWTSPDMPTDATWTVEADITGTGIATAERASFKVVRAFTSAAGVITAGPVGILFQDTTSATLDAYVALSGSAVVALAADATLGAMRWTAVIKTTETLVES